MTIDGRSKISRGMTAKECQDLLRYVEKVYGIKLEFCVNLDGGGSTRMIHEGVTVNEPSDKEERYIGTYVYLAKV